ncbi:hypothetical protein [Mucilaginibacter segetis]|uniref:Uncharacterized protein n=1 Tax=Mucilaginibacter segetis TaxID=2793071 RepID=A0A934PX23_9SPHI|nr:hypothetical protein [Mucilaginibacter segetis]MBK0381092.1 hypothetical protein [Mucilaginibacter segetis]
MELNNEYNTPVADENAQPNAYPVNDDNNKDENDLKTNYLFGKGDLEKSGNEPGMEGSPQGGQSFGENNNTPSGDDKNNPSQNAGYANGYFSRTEPSEEHPEDTNFKDPNQQGQSNYTQAKDATKTGQSDSQHSGQLKNEANESKSQESYQEGTADGEDTNIPGPNEVPEQQKVGEDNTSEDGKADYKPENGEGKPDYGSHSPENK